MKKERENAKRVYSETGSEEERIERKEQFHCEEGSKKGVLSEPRRRIEEKSTRREGSVRWRPTASAVSVCEQDGL